MIPQGSAGTNPTHGAGQKALIKNYGMVTIILDKYNFCLVSCNLTGAVFKVEAEKIEKSNIIHL